MDDSLRPCPPFLLLPSPFHRLRGAKRETEIVKMYVSEICFRMIPACFSAPGYRKGLDFPLFLCHLGLLESRSQ